MRIPSNHCPRTLGRYTQHRPGAAFDEAVVLLDDVVQVLALAERRTRSEQSLVFDGVERDPGRRGSCPRSRLEGTSYETHRPFGGKTRWPPSCRAWPGAQNPACHRWNQRPGTDSARPRRHARTSRRLDTNPWCVSRTAGTVRRSPAHSAAPIGRSSYGRPKDPVRASFLRDRGNSPHSASTTERNRRMSSGSN